MDGAAREDDRGQRVFPNELPRPLVFAGYGAVFFDGGFADEVELVGRQVRRDAEEFAVDEVVQEQLGFYAGDGGRIVFGRQVDAGVDDFCRLVPGFAVERGLVGAPGGVGADRQPLAAFAAAVVFSLELFERHAEAVALEFVELVSGRGAPMTELPADWLFFRGANRLAKPSTTWAKRAWLMSSVAMHFNSASGTFERSYVPSSDGWKINRIALCWRR